MESVVEMKRRRSDCTSSTGYSGVDGREHLTSPEETSPKVGITGIDSAICVVNKGVP